MKPCQLCFNVGLFFVAILLGLFHVAILNDRVCDDIITLRETIYWIGLLRNRFILITSAWNVYDLSTSALDNVGHKLYLSGPKQLLDIYPELHRRMTQDATGFFSGGQRRLTVIDQAGEYLYTESQDFSNADVYDLQNKKTTHYRMQDSTKDQQPILTMSSYEPLHYYAIYYHGSGDASGQMTKVAFLSGNTLTGSTTAHRQDNLYYICKVGTTADQIALSSTKCKDGTADWSAVNGFADSYNFYVMATNRTVMVFATSAFNNPGTPVRVNEIRNEDFFICGNNSNAVIILLAVAGIIMVAVVFTLCCVLLCLRGQGRGALVTAQGQASDNVQMSTKKSRKSRSRSRGRASSRRSKRRSRSRSRRR